MGRNPKTETKKPRTATPKENGVWLNKFISESGICSRRVADRYIEQGYVFVNDKRAQKGDQVFNGDRVRVNGMELEPRQSEDLVFIAFNKPVGIVSTTEKTTVDNIVEYVNHSSRIFPVGRLDKDSQGLIFLTNNGDLVNKILRAGNNHEKEYLVTVNKPVNDAFIEGMSNGVPILGVTTKKCKVVAEGAKVFKIVLKQGMNRQIRRMCEHFGYEVTKLERTRIMNITLTGIPQGHWRDLTEDEMKQIYELTKDSSSEAAPKKKAASPAPKKPAPDTTFATPVPARKPHTGRTAPSGDKRKSDTRFSDAKPFADRSGKRTTSGSKPQSGGRRGGGKSKPASGGRRFR
jgi:23S rRNA pseudouridine2604 synthase